MHGAVVARPGGDGAAGEDKGHRHDGDRGKRRITPIRHLAEPEDFTKRRYSLPDPFTSWEGIEVRRQATGRSARRSRS